MTARLPKCRPFPVATINSLSRNSRKPIERIRVCDLDSEHYLVTIPSHLGVGSEPGPAVVPAVDTISNTSSTTSPASPNTDAGSTLGVDMFLAPALSIATSNFLVLIDHRHDSQFLPPGLWADAYNQGLGTTFGTKFVRKKMTELKEDDYLVIDNRLGDLPRTWPSIVGSKTYCKTFKVKRMRVCFTDTRARREDALTKWFLPRCIAPDPNLDIKAPIVRSFRPEVGEPMILAEAIAAFTAAEYFVWHNTVCRVRISSFADKRRNIKAQDIFSSDPEYDEEFWNHGFIYVPTIEKEFWAVRAIDEEKKTLELVNTLLDLSREIELPRKREELTKNIIAMFKKDQEKTTVIIAKAIGKEGVIAVERIETLIEQEILHQGIGDYAVDPDAVIARRNKKRKAEAEKETPPPRPEPRTRKANPRKGAGKTLPAQSIPMEAAPWLVGGANSAVSPMSQSGMQPSGFMPTSNSYTNQQPISFNGEMGFAGSSTMQMQHVQPAVSLPHTQNQAMMQCPSIPLRSLHEMPRSSFAGFVDQTYSAPLLQAFQMPQYQGFGQASQALQESQSMVPWAGVGDYMAPAQSQNALARQGVPLPAEVSYSGSLDTLSESPAGYNYVASGAIKSLPVDPHPGFLFAAPDFGLEDIGTAFGTETGQTIQAGNELMDQSGASQQGFPDMSFPFDEEIHSGFGGLPELSVQAGNESEDVSQLQATPPLVQTAEETWSEENVSENIGAAADSQIALPTQNTLEYAAPVQAVPEEPLGQSAAVDDGLSLSGAAPPVSTYADEFALLDMPDFDFTGFGLDIPTFEPSILLSGNHQLAAFTASPEHMEVAVEVPQQPAQDLEAPDLQFGEQTEPISGIESFNDSSFESSTYFSDPWDEFLN